MFTIIRKFRLTRGSAAEISRRVRESFVPLLQELPGFRGYYLLEGGPDVLVSVRVFDSADEALASNEIAATWMRENVLEFVKGMPEVMAGNVLVAAEQVRILFAARHLTRIRITEKFFATRSGASFGCSSHRGRATDRRPCAHGARGQGRDLQLGHCSFLAWWLGFPHLASRSAQSVRSRCSSPFSALRTMPAK